MRVSVFCCKPEKVKALWDKIEFFSSKMFYVRKYLKITKAIVGLNIIGDR